MDKKFNTPFYRYKNQIKADTKPKLIKVYDASVHDSKAMMQLLTEKKEEQPLYSDSPYAGEYQEAVYKKKKIINKINKKGYRNKPLTEEQKPTTERNSGHEQRSNTYLDL